MEQGECSISRMEKVPSRACSNNFEAETAPGMETPVEPSKEEPQDSRNLNRPSITIEGMPEENYGPWMLVARRRNRQTRDASSKPASDGKILLGNQPKLNNFGSKDSRKGSRQSLEKTKPKQENEVPTYVETLQQPTILQAFTNDTNTSTIFRKSGMSKSRAGKQRILKAHFDTEVQQLRPIGASSEKRNMDGGDASPQAE